MFFMRIFHQRHENWLHLLFARVFLSDCPGRKFRIYLTILCYVSSGDNSEIKPAFTKCGAKHTQGSSTRILSPSVSELHGYKQLRRVFSFEK